jgi:hypothetical protein
MGDHVYKIVELAGTSQDGVEAAIRNALGRAQQTLRNLRWFEVTQIRGHVNEGQPCHFQVILKAGFTLDGEGG